MKNILSQDCASIRRSESMVKVRSVSSARVGMFSSAVSNSTSKYLFSSSSKLSSSVLISFFGGTLSLIPRIGRWVSAIGSSSS